MNLRDAKKIVMLVAADLVEEEAETQPDWMFKDAEGNELTSTESARMLRAADEVAADLRKRAE